jgi:predicted CXXCH cytochrome family protein
MSTFGQASDSKPHPAYVGSESCIDCHKGAAEAWKTSHHAWAWKKPDRTSVLGNFEDAELEHKGITSKFFTRDGRYFVSTDGPDGKITEFEVHSTVGVTPLQQYLVELKGGRLQALDLSWDTEAKRWYHLYPDQDLKAGDGMHWSGPYKSWNARCAECHATNYDKNYDPKTRTYNSTQSEIGVGCEACHGPGEAHVAWARSPSISLDERWPGLTKQGFTVNLSDPSPETEIQQCAGCHSRREPFGDGNPLPGTAYHDAYRLALLRNGQYHADGSIRDEVYVYGSFLQSKMYAKGVRCSNCHEPHAGRLKAEGNALCTQCHSPAGNERFPSLRKAVYDDPAHHFHEQGTDGAQCKSCHMIERTYMQVDGRRDHSFRVPRPDLSDQTGAPNSCTDCHADKPASWAAAEIARRYPDSKYRGHHFAQTFSAAWNDPTGEVADLLKVANDPSQAGIVRATAVELLRAGGADAAAQTSSLLRDPDPLVREAAVGVQAVASPQDRVQRLVPLLADRYKSVRLATARALLATPLDTLDPAAMNNFKSASDEWKDSLRAKADFPETHLILGGVALTMRNVQAAEQAFQEAARQDPQLLDAWIMLVRIRAAVGDLEGARSFLKQAMDSNPGSDELDALSKQFP